MVCRCPQDLDWEREMTRNLPKIGWIGLGKMGLPICRRLRGAGHDVIVLVRNVTGSERAIANGFATADGISDLAARCDIVFSAISDDAALIDIVAGPDALARCLRPHQSFVDISTVSPSASQGVAERLAAQHVLYLRAPVSGSTVMAEAGTLTTMVSGPRSGYDQLAPIFAAYTRKQFYVGEGEAARQLKLAVNLLVGATSAMLAEALAFGRKGGLDLATMLDVIAQSAVASPLIDYKRKALVEGDYTPAFALSQIMKDFDLLLMTGAQQHCPLPLAAQIRQQFEGANARGHGARDFFVLAADIARLAQVRGADH